MLMDQPFMLLAIGAALMPLSWLRIRQWLSRLLPASHSVIMDSMDDAIFILDVRHCIVDANGVMETLTGRSRHALRGRNVFEVIPSAAAFAEQYRTAARLREEILVIENGKQLYYDMQLSPIYGWRQKVSGYIFVLRDITRQRHVEILLRRHTEDLEHRNRELDAFSHTVAHDLRAPLSVIKGYAELMLESDARMTAGDVQRYAAGIHNASKSMDDMIANLLLLASLSDHSETLVEVNTRTVIRSALRRFQPQIEGRGIQFEISQHLPNIWTQPSWLEAVFANLISNAIKYIGSDNPQPYIRITGTREGSTVRYEVRDNGIGISPEQQTRLFEMFTRFHRGEADGMGIGLSIVLRVVSRLGGDVGVISEPGRGSTFWFTLPDTVASLRLGLSPSLEPETTHNTPIRKHDTPVAHV
jgi:PAS domain S-box-containing protein